MNTEYNSIIFILAWILLPIIPAFLFFKIIPSQADISGPLKGLQLKIGGAFAGYFILFIVLYSLMNKLIIKDDKYEIWTVSGRIFDANNNIPINDKSSPYITLIPSTEINNGDFKFLIIGRKEEGGEVVFPKIKVEAENYSSITLDDLDFISTKDSIKGSWHLDFDHKKATLSKLTLVKDPSIFPNDLNSISNVESDK